MTPTEKAKELYVAYAKIRHASTDDVKASAIITVNEIINMAKIFDIHNIETGKSIYTSECVNYWEQVKEEINKL